MGANNAYNGAKASLNAEHSVLLNSVITQYATILSSYESLMALKTQAAYLKKVYEQIDLLEKTVMQTNRNYITLEIFPYIIGIAIFFFLLKEGIILSSLIGVRS